MLTDNSAAGTTAGDRLLVLLRDGDHVAATAPTGERFLGIVELSAPHLGVLWARDAHTGERRIVPGTDLDSADC